jgi:hypothetical protein
MPPLRMTNSLRRRVRAGSVHLNRVPNSLNNVVKTPKTVTEWRRILEDITEAFYKRFWFYHPVKCAPGVLARRPTMKGSTEIYRCPSGTTQSFRRFNKTSNFFKFRYGRGGEFAQGLYAILRHIGVRCRMVLGYWGGANALWVEAWNPWTKRWVALDPSYKHGYGHKFMRKGMIGVIALEDANGTVVNRKSVY